LWVLGPATFEIEQIIEARHHEHGNLESQAQATVSDARTKTIDIPDLVTNSTYWIKQMKLSIWDSKRSQVDSPLR